jgi:hypothetical protein
VGAPGSGAEAGSRGHGRRAARESGTRRCLEHAQARRARDAAAATEASRVLQLLRSGGTTTQGCGVAVTGGSRRWRGNCCRQPWRCRPRSWPRQTQVRVLPRSGQLQWAAGFLSLSFLFRSSWLLVLTSAHVTAGIRCTRRAAARRWI